MLQTNKATYEQLCHELETIKTFLKGIYDFEPTSEYYKKWKDTEIEYWTEELIKVKEKLDAKINTLPIDVIMYCIKNGSKIELPEKF